MASTERSGTRGYQQQHAGDTPLNRTRPRRCAYGGLDHVSDAGAQGRAGEEALNAPRVIFSTGEIVPSPGESSQQPIFWGTFIWSLSGRTETADALRWNGEPVRVSVRDDELEVSAGAVRGDAVSLADFDYVRDIYGVTATLASDRTEFLALLLDPRRSGRRSLLLVFNPRGTVVHTELMDRRLANPILFAAGEPGHQEISVNAG